MPLLVCHCSITSLCVCVCFLAIVQHHARHVGIVLSNTQFEYQLVLVGAPVATTGFGATHQKHDDSGVSEDDISISLSIRPRQCDPTLLYSVLILASRPGVVISVWNKLSSGHFKCTNLKLIIEMHLNSYMVYFFGSKLFKLTVFCKNQLKQIEFLHSTFFFILYPNWRNCICYWSFGFLLFFRHSLVNFTSGKDSKIAYSLY